MQQSPRIAILISGTGTNMHAILNAIKDGELFSYKELGKADAEEAIALAIEEAGADWIVLAGFMRILSPDFVRRFAGRIINIHPALLPLFPGAHGIQDAWDAGVPETGVTIHIVDEEVDHGPILAQESVKREPEDTIETLEAKIHAVEHKLYKKTLKDFHSVKIF